MERPPPAPGHRRLAGDVLVLLVACIGCFMFSSALVSDVVLDSVPVNFALAIDRFNVAEHQPHPPGYLGYVVLLRAVRFATGLEPLQAVLLTSRLMAMLSIIFCFGAAASLVPSSRRPARWAAVLAATHPLIIYYGVDGQTHAAEGAVAAALLWCLVALRKRPTWKSAVLIGLVMALGGSLRPTYLVVAVGPVVWVMWRHKKLLLLTGLVAVAGTFAWFVPTVALSGGLDAYSAATNALVGTTFGRTTSVLSSQSDSRMVAENLRSVLVWGAIALGPALIAFAAHAIGRRYGENVSSPSEGTAPDESEPASKRPTDGDARFAGIVLLTAAVPAILFYAMVFCAEAGYLQGLVPFSLVGAAVALGGEGSRRAWYRTWQGLTLCVIMGAQVTFFFQGPAGRPLVAKMPTLEEIELRTVVVHSLMRRLEQGIEPGDRILVVSDFPDGTSLRQMPLLRPGTDVLTYYSERLVVFPTTTIGLATASSWHAAPGPALLQSGPPTDLETDADYDWVVIDPRATAELRDIISAQTSCAVTEPGPDYQAAHLDAHRCFPDHIIRLPPHRVLFDRSSGR